MKQTVEKQINDTISWLKGQVQVSKTQGILVGLSGGIDSAVVGNLIKSAFPNNSLGVILPCKSSEQDKKDARDIAQKAGLETAEIDLTSVHEDLFKETSQHFSSTGFAPTRLVDANLRARLRMSTLYTLANHRGYLVAGTDNAAELFTGYFTKYGDGGVDILPIAHLLKSEVYTWARYFKVPQQVIDRPPSAGLWPGQTDEKEMGITYHAIDCYLKGERVEKKEEEIIRALHKKTEHKRNMPPQPFPNRWI